MARTRASAAEILAKWKPTTGLPSFAFRIDYVGPKTRLEVSYQLWHQGKDLGSAESHETLDLPVSDDAAFGFLDGKNGQQVSVIVAHEVITPQSDRPSRSSPGVMTQQFDLPALRDRAIRTHEPSWPLEIPDGKDGVVWAVFVDEPADVPAGATPEERAKRADTALIFRIRTADAKK